MGYGTSRAVKRHRSRAPSRSFSGSSTVRVAAAAARLYRSMSRTRTQRRSLGEAPVVSQYHEDKVTYRKRNAPKGVRKAQSKRFKNVMSVLDSTLPSTHCKFNSNAYVVTTGGGVGAGGAGTQEWMFAHMNTINGSGSGGEFAHFWHILNDTFKPTNPLSTVQSTYWNKKCAIQSSVLDLEITADAGNAYSACVDVYECVYFKDQLLTTDLQQFTNFPLDNSSNSMTNTYRNPETSLFDISAFTSHCKILKKRELVMAPATTLRLQFKDNRKRYVSGQVVAEAGIALKGITKIIVMSVRGPPILVGTAIQLGSVTVSINKVNSYVARPMNSYGDTLQALT